MSVVIRGLLQRLEEHLEEGEASPPHYTGSRCLLERGAMQGCDLCQQVCPHEALTLRDPDVLQAGIMLDEDLCTGCGLCVQVCPSGALEYDLTAILQSLRDQNSSTLTCSQSGVDGPQLTCLGGVTPALLAMAGVWRSDMTLLHGHCADCALGSGDVPDRLVQVIEEATRLRTATGKTMTTTVRQAEEKDRAEPTISRRESLLRLFRSGRHYVGHTLPETPLTFLESDEETPLVPVPAEWGWRQRALRPYPAVDAGVYWPAPLVNDTCIDCPVCANVCPTEAIQREVLPSGGTELSLHLAACTSCRACIEACPPQAMYMQDDWMTVAFGAPIVLRESEDRMENRIENRVEHRAEKSSEQKPSVTSSDQSMNQINQIDEEESEQV